MRGGKSLVIVAGVGILVAGCGTKPAPVGNVAAAAASTAGRSARVAVRMSLRTDGISVSLTEKGAFDFAHSRGMFRLHGPGGVAAEERFVPPRMYVKPLDGSHRTMPRGKSWIAIGLRTPAGLAGVWLGSFGGADPGNLLASLRAVASSVTTLGSTTIRGVPVTHFRVRVDPAKAASRLPRWQRAGLRAFAKSLGAATIPVDVWVDQQNLVRRVRISLRPQTSSGAPRGARITQTADFYDFGVPVRVSPPPAAEVISLPRLGKGGLAVGSGSSGSSAVSPGSAAARPPRVSGTLSPAQAAAAEQAVRSFWSALGSNDTRAIARAVVPSERRCLRPMLSGLRFTVTSLRIVSARPAGNARATVRFTVTARARISGHSVPLFPEGLHRVQWLVAADVGGHWYANPGRSSNVGFGGVCR